MVEAMEEAQKALRKMDYDSMSDDGDDDEEQGGWSRKRSPKRVPQDSHPAAKLPPPEVSSESKSSLETFLSSSDTGNNGTINNPDEDLLFGTTQPFSQTTSTPKSTSITSFEISQPDRAMPSESLLSPASKFFNESRPQNALMDDDDSTTFSVELQTLNMDNNPNGIIGNSSSPDTLSNNKYPGTAGFLEMEEEPLRSVHNNDAFGSEPIKTDSGLVLTHRKNSNTLPNRNKQVQNLFRDTQQDYFEEDNDFVRGGNKGNPNFPHRREGGSYFGGVTGGILGGGNGKHSMVMVQVKRLMSYVKIWVILFLIVATVMTGVFFHSMGHEEAVTKTDSISSQESSSINANANVNVNGFDTVPDQILLVPLMDSSHLSSLQQNQQNQNGPRRLHDVNSYHHGNVDASHHFLKDLRQEFESWILHHGKAYHSDAEKEHRFSIWAKNHQRTAEKNAKHGPCKLTKQHVFGSNEFKDLAPEEFQSKFLTGYKGAFTDELEKKHQELSPAARRARSESGVGKVLDPQIHKVKIHESVVERQRHLGAEFQPHLATTSSLHCDWFDLSCVLRFIWTSTGLHFGSLIGTMEPKYDADAYPNAVDWRDSGAVTSIRTQGDCGACWAVTATETVESAHFIATGNLYTLSESEIIVCDESCEMCSGGWPQNAFEWVMEHGGLPLQNTLPYDAYTLLALTSALEGTSNYYTEETLETYRGEVCPADYDSRASDGNNENYWENGSENENYGDYSSQGRYGNIKGYGYATDRCVCYTDGSGCDCDDQDEDTAIRNIATYGPAVVCLEASTWQDYSGGIMTSEIGCGHGFSDMNHCVQVVGYAFATNSGCNGDNCNNDGSGSEDGSSDREGYWIVRNQWGESWGMNGYAYVSMGENTCGILNDMAMAYA